MKIEDKLREIIADRYGSMTAFAKSINMPTPTLASIMSRGIRNASIDNVLKICKALGISADELENDKIVPREQGWKDQEKRDVVLTMKTEMLSNDNLTIDGEIITNEDKQMLIDALELSVELIKRKNRRQRLS